MHRLSSTAISLLPASEDDIASLVRVHMAGFANDNPARLMFQNKDEYETMLVDMLKAQLSDPKIAVTKADGKHAISLAKMMTWRARKPLQELQDDVRTLRSVLKEDRVKVEKYWKADRKYIHFYTLVVDPAAQGHGVGTASVRWVTDTADEHEMYCWLQSSPAAHNIYLKAGYRDVGSFEVDLREFAPGGMEGGWGWGMYKFRYMLRLPGSQGSG